MKVIFFILLANIAFIAVLRSFFITFKRADSLESQLLNKKIESRENSDMQI